MAKGFFFFNRLRKKNEQEQQDEQSERILFEMFYHRIYSTAYFITQDRDLAQDIVQETFIKAFKHMHTLEDGKKIGAWLSSIASRLALDYLRKIKRWNDVATEDLIIDEEINKKQNQTSSIETIMEERFLKTVLRQEINALGPDYRQVIILKYEYDMKDEEIAKALEISVGTVKSRLHRAKQKLKDSLEKQPDIWEGGA
ncbi:RNA polymerase sigma factor [Paenibacillus sp. sptzw28]|uniref:RNA polymerase sigma factor n=1 Tax=Paenibacillus sp. sptzw28 TaxID=715179 RepID=UPI0021631F62|nr:RNA polymerase sigma factor [Paenibacillus sp. sptzw28]